MSETIKSPDCPQTEDRRHSIRDATEAEYPAYKTCVECGTKFYLVNQVVFDQMNIDIVPKESTNDE